MEIQHIFWRWSPGQLWKGSLNLLRASWAFPAPPGSALGGSWEQQDFGGFATRKSFNNPANFSLLPLMNMALIWDFFLFSLGRKMIKTRPGNLWSRRGLYLLGKGAAAAFAYSPARVPLMPHPRFHPHNLEFTSLSKETTGNSRLYSPFKPETGQIIFSCARQDFSGGISNISL